MLLSARPRLCGDVGEALQRREGITLDVARGPHGSGWRAFCAEGSRTSGPIPTTALSAQDRSVGGAFLRSEKPIQVADPDEFG